MPVGTPASSTPSGPAFFELTRQRQLQFSATTVANLAGGKPFFTLDDLNAERSIYQDFTHAELLERGFPVQPRTPAQAGRILGRQARRYDFTLYEYFLTDKAGHSQDPARCRDHLGRLDAFLAALLEELEKDLEEDTLVLLSSDHGNIEDLSTKRHTTNPVPLMAWGRDGARVLEQVERLDQVTPAIVQRHL